MLWKTKTPSPQLWLVLAALVASALDCTPGAVEPPAARKSSSDAPGEEERGPPNILFILADDLGYGDLACFGNPVIQTPNLDRLATEGVKLTQCYAASPNCSPARAALLTGRMPYRVGIYDFVRESYPLHILTSETTVATLLSNAGYDTFLVGKWHLSGGQLDDERKHLTTPGDHGFRTWLCDRNSFDYNPGTLVRNGKPAGELKGFQSQIVTRETIDWLDNGWDRTKPFMAFVWMHEPHVPVRSDARFQKLYENLGEEADAIQYGGEGVERPTADKLMRARYFGAVSQMDFEIGRLLTKLEKMGLVENTLVYFTSDNGPEHRYDTSWGSPGPYRGAKGHIHEGGIRVPGIVRWPGRIPAGSISDEPVNGTDLLPTLCAVAGITPDPKVTIDGVNVLPAWIEGKPLERGKPLFWWLYHARGGRQAALRMGDYKILARMVHPMQPTRKDLFPPQGTELMEFIKRTDIEDFQLYDVVRDPGETQELSKEKPEVYAKLRALLLATYEEIQKEGPWWSNGGVVTAPEQE
jgi:arylsulfatase A